MKIPETRFDVGYKFWVPRVRKQWHEEVMMLDGKRWVHEVEVLVSYVKQKEIVDICIDISKHETKIQYHIKNVVDNGNPYDSYVHLVDEKEIHNYTETQALEEAKRLESKGEEYFEY